MGSVVDVIAGHVEVRNACIRRLKCIAVQRKMNVFAISNHISGGGQLFPTKFGTLVVPPMGYHV